MLDENLFEIKWSIPTKIKCKRDLWNWPECVRYALTFFLGETVQLLQREIKVGRIIRIERRKLTKSKSLFPFMPIHNTQLLNKDVLLQLIQYFYNQSAESNVCRKIINQIAEASRQKTLQGAQLLLTTILEAVLRSLNNQPFVPGDRKSFPRKKYLEDFKKKYFSSQWSDSCEKALNIFEDLRHKNAHPDWLTSETDNWTDEAFEEEIKSMSFLSQFYGYMIKALAGFKDLEPKFSY